MELLLDRFSIWSSPGALPGISKMIDPDLLRAATAFGLLMVSNDLNCWKVEDEIRVIESDSMTPMYSRREISLRIGDG